MDGIFFPGIKIFFDSVRNGFQIGNFHLTIYGVIVTAGFVLAYFICSKMGKESGIDDEQYLDFYLRLIIPAIVGARLYYIIFNFKDYIGKGSIWKNFLSMINIGNGGLAIYGGIIAGVITGVIFCRRRKISTALFADTITYGLLTGQILGRWGNFFNREAFGRYTGSFVRMAIPIDYFKNRGVFETLCRKNVLTNEMLVNTETVKGLECVTVYPTFLFESIWNLMTLVFIFFYRKHKKFDGELALIYLMLYGFGRFFIEGLRTDSLMLGPLRISQIVAAVCFLGSLALIIYFRRSGRIHNRNNI